MVLMSIPEYRATFWFTWLSRSDTNFPNPVLHHHQKISSHWETIACVFHLHLVASPWQPYKEGFQCLTDPIAFAQLGPLRLDVERAPIPRQMPHTNFLALGVQVVVCSVSSSSRISTVWRIVSDFLKNSRTPCSLSLVDWWQKTRKQHTGYRLSQDFRLGICIPPSYSLASRFPFFFFVKYRVYIVCSFPNPAQPRNICLLILFFFMVSIALVRSCEMTENIPLGSLASKELSRNNDEVQSYCVKF